jgi:predicted amidohydrolase YtcJ
LYLVDEGDRPRFAELGVVADFQLAPSSVDAYYTSFMRGLIGTTRASQLLPALELYSEGALVTLSSDWDADVLSPIRKIQTVLTRPDGRSFSNLESVISLLTLNPAILLQHADKTGSLEVDKAADLVLLDKNIFELPVSEIHRANVMLTVLQGEAVYDPEGIMGEEIGIVPVRTSQARSFEGRWMRLLVPCLSLSISLLLAR